MVQSPSWQANCVQLVKKFPAFHGTRRFITALKSVRQLSLSWNSSIQSKYPLPTSWRSILILLTHLRLGLPSGSFPPVSPIRPYTTPSPHPYAPHAQPISFFSILSPAQYWVNSTNHLAARYAFSSIPPFKNIYKFKKNRNWKTYNQQLRIVYKFSYNVGYFITKIIINRQNFATLHDTSPNQTSPHFTQLHFSTLIDT